jgi:hypothetical protein
MHFSSLPFLLHALPISYSFMITLIIFGEVYKLCSSSLCSLIQPPATSSLLDPYILLSNLFSYTLNLCFPRNVKYQVSHPYTIGGKIKFLLTY